MIATFVTLAVVVLNQVGVIRKRKTGRVPHHIWWHVGRGLAPAVTNGGPLRSDTRFSKRQRRFVTEPNTPMFCELKCADCSSFRMQHSVLVSPLSSQTGSQRFLAAASSFDRGSQVTTTKTWRWCSTTGKHRGTWTTTHEKGVIMPRYVLCEQNHSRGRQPLALHVQ